MENIHEVKSAIRKTIEMSGFNHDIVESLTTGDISFHVGYDSLTMADTESYMNVGYFIHTVYITRVMHNGVKRRGLKVFLKRLPQ
jgi:hypothetical protein